MREKIMKINELAEITNLKANTIRDYLTNYRFNKFMTYIMENGRKRLVYQITSNFANEFARILYLRQKWDAVKLWGDYCGENYLNILDEEYQNA